MKVKMRSLNDNDLKELRRINIEKAKMCVQQYPTITPLEVSTKTGLSLSFILSNKKEIGLI